MSNFTANPAALQLTCSGKAVRGPNPLSPTPARQLPAFFRTLASQGLRMLELLSRLLLSRLLLAELLRRQIVRPQLQGTRLPTRGTSCIGLWPWPDLYSPDPVSPPLRQAAVTMAPIKKIPGDVAGPAQDLPRPRQ